MSRRGSYAKGVAKREEILATALELVAVRGYSRTTVRELADAVGLSQAGLLHYFGTKEQLFTEILRHRDQTDRAAFMAPRPTDGFAEDYARLVRHNAGVPGLVQLHTRFSAEATDPQHPSHLFFRERAAAARAMTAETLRRLRDERRLPVEADPDKLAVILAALTDGLQTAWLYDPQLDMAAHVSHLLSLITGGEPVATEAAGPPEA